MKHYHANPQHAALAVASKPATILIAVSIYYAKEAIAVHLKSQDAEKSDVISIIMLP